MKIKRKFEKWKELELLLSSFKIQLVASELWKCVKNFRELLTRFLKWWLWWQNLKIKFSSCELDSVDKYPQNLITFASKLCLKIAEIASNFSQSRQIYSIFLYFLQFLILSSFPHYIMIIHIHQTESTLWRWMNE